MKDLNKVCAVGIYEVNMRGETITDGEHIYKVCFPTINGVIVTNEDGERLFLSHPLYKSMTKL